VKLIQEKCREHIVLHRHRHMQGAQKINLPKSQQHAGEVAQMEDCLPSKYEFKPQSHTHTHTHTHKPKKQNDSSKE
jgi:hypothetical protein